MKTFSNLARLLGLLTLGVGAFWAMHQLFAWTEGQDDTMQLPARLAVLALYAMLIAIPFLPSFNLSMIFMLMQGPDQIWLAYGATVIGFCLPFVAGRLIPEPYLIGLFDRLGMRRMSEVIGDTQAMPTKDRLRLITDLSPPRLKPLVNKWRYIAFWAALNFPGNVVIGGAGGLLLVAGLSRLFAPLVIFGTISVSLCVIPIVITVTGLDILGWLGQ